MEKVGKILESVFLGGVVIFSVILYILSPIIRLIFRLLESSGIAFGGLTCPKQRK